MKYDVFNEFSDFKQKKKNEYIIVLPLLRLEISNKLTIGDFVLYPKASLDFNKLTKNNISDRIEENRELFNSSTLLAFRKQIDISTPFSQVYDKTFISQAFQESEKLLNLIKFFYCKYFDSSTLIGKSGQREDGKIVIFVFDKIGSPFTGIREDYFLTHQIIKGIGLSISDYSPIDKNDFFRKPKNEVGNILTQALELNSMVLEANTNTQKFILSMNLIEYLANPYSFMPFQKAKGKIICHNTDNKVDYNKLAERFKELTKGIEDEQGNLVIGLRTEIVHNGKVIEHLIPNEKELQNLFKELQKYIYNTIIDMFSFSDKVWEDLDNFRKEKFSLIQKTKTPSAKKDIYSDGILLIDLDFLDRETKRWFEFYNDLYPAKKIKEVFIENLIIQSCIQSRIESSDEILTVVLLTTKGAKYSFSEKVVKLSEKDFFSFDITKKYKFDVQVLRFGANQNKFNYISEFLNNVSKEGNTFFDRISGKINNYYICIDDKSYFDFLTNFKKRKNLQLIRLCQWETELDIKDVLFIDVAHVIGFSLGLEKHEL